MQATEPTTKLPVSEIGLRVSEAAAAYAKAGFAVFPLRPRDKRPLLPRRCTCPAGQNVCGGTGHGVLDATTDLDLVGRWWSAHPSANIGMRVPDELVVIDLDPRNGALETSLESLPETATTWSGRGDGGRHLWFRRPMGPITGAHLPGGWDLKTSTGYVVVPPSIHPVTGRPYRWGTYLDVAAVPEWLEQLLRPVRVRFQVSLSGPASPSSRRRGARRVESC